MAGKHYERNAGIKMLGQGAADQDALQRGPREACPAERTTDLAQTVKALNQVLAFRTQQLHALASELTGVEQRERRRLAEVLHDHLQQILVAAKVQMTPLRRAKDPRLRAAAEEVTDLLRQAIAASRSLTTELCPPVLHEQGWTGALKWLGRWMLEKHGLKTEVVLDEHAAPRSKDVMAMLFQCARELLFNVVKHAGVREARIEVTQRQDMIRLIVSDSGKGFDPTQIRTQSGSTDGFGLFDIRERLTLLGGAMEISSSPGRGTRVTLTAPGD